MRRVTITKRWEIPEFNQKDLSFRDLRSPNFGERGWLFELRFQPTWTDSPFPNVVSLIPLSRPNHFEGSIFWSLSVRDPNNVARYLCVNQKLLIKKNDPLIPCWTVFPPDTMTEGKIHTTYEENMIFEAEIKVEPRSHRAAHVHGHSPYPARVNVDNPLPASDKQLEFLNTGQLSDFTIVTSCGREFKTHMVILANHSDYFQTLFNHNDTKEMREKKVEFTDIPGTVMEVILHWIYAHTSGEGFMTDDDLSEELIETVNRLLIPSMSMYISNFLSKDLTNENVLPRAAIAWIHYKETAYRDIVNYFVANVDDIILTEAYTMMREEEPYLIIELHEEKCRARDILNRNMNQQQPYENRFFVPPDVPPARPYFDRPGFIGLDHNGYPLYNNGQQGAGLGAVNHGPHLQLGVRHRVPNRDQNNGYPPVNAPIHNPFEPLAQAPRHFAPPVNNVRNVFYPVNRNFAHQLPANFNFDAPVEVVPNDIVFNGVIFRPQQQNGWDNGVEDINNHFHDFGFN